MTGYLDTLLGYQLRRASSVMIADLATDCARLGLSVPGISILFTIADAQMQDDPGRSGISQSEIGRLLGIQRANMVPLTALLEQKGLIERREVDGRSHALLLTKAGRVMLARARRTVEAHEARFLPGTPAEQRAQLVHMLATIWQR